MAVIPMRVRMAIWRGLAPPTSRMPMRMATKTMPVPTSGWR